MIKHEANTKRLPVWFKQGIPDAITLDTMHLLSEFKVNTVCREAKCPNLSSCFKKRELTFIILGDTCTRNCRFCAVNKSQGRALGLDADEPDRISRIIKELGLGYAVITSVTRDDLPDAGSGQFAKTIKLIRSISQNIKIEILIPDFLLKFSSLKQIVEAEPTVVAHNLETVRRLYAELRPAADYGRCLAVLKTIKEIDVAMVTKSSLMLGLGESEEEILRAMKDLRCARCDILTMGQYLAPSGDHYPVKEFIAPGQFRKYRDIALGLGFKGVLSGPLARSSYNAEDLYRRSINA